MSSDPTRTRAERSAFRAWVRAHHPDVGGDHAEFVAGLERMRAGRGVPSARTPSPGAEAGGARADDVSTYRRRGGLWLLIRWWRRVRRREPRVR
ncbi:hypothetical protein [Actinopolymorpha rutila]|uniref:Uncharacterized protein n=1 Tax=Actinopolymorpha rutila TaxID=446787 RepID=A0A852ZCN5_9ACTN|nr:hypothetical protein [Actinopolymorpha rutila]NYH87469.1 hypothetical protein [Actinopolymorpha rutila]